MNPARSFASAVPAQVWSGIWIYFTAPSLGMLLAAQAHLSIRGRGALPCAKLHHENAKRCIFCASRMAGGRAFLSPPAPAGIQSAEAR